MGDISRCYRWPLQWTAGSFFQVRFQILREMLVWSHFLYLTRLKPMQKGQVTCPKWQSDWVAPRPLLPAPGPPMLLSQVTKIQQPVPKVLLPQVISHWNRVWRGMSVPKCVEKHDFCPHQQACKCLFSPSFPPVPPGPTATSASPLPGRLPLHQHLSKEGRLQNTLLLRGLFLLTHNLLTHLID